MLIKEIIQCESDSSGYILHNGIYMTVDWIPQENCRVWRSLARYTAVSRKPRSDQTESAIYSTAFENEHARKETLSDRKFHRYYSKTQASIAQ